MRLFFYPYDGFRVLALLILSLSASGCSSWKSGTALSHSNSPTSSPEKTAGLFDAKPNARQARIDLAVVVAEQHEAKKEYRDAMKKYQEILSLDKKNALAHHRLALLTCQMSDSKQAQEHFENAKRLAPDDQDIVADYAYWQYLNNRNTQSLELVEEGLRHNPDSQRFLGIKGLLLARSRQFEPAVESFVRSGCTPQEAWANIGHVLLLEGDVQAASYWIDSAAQGDQGSKVAKRTLNVLQASATARSY